MGDMFSGMDISASGLSAEKARMDIISNNLANANTTRGADGKPYSRKMIIFSELLADKLTGGVKMGQGVKVDAIIESDTPFKRIHDPSHPDADKDGFVEYPNVDPIKEMVDMITSTRAYEANISAYNAAKMMSNKALEMGK